MIEFRRQALTARYRSPDSEEEAEACSEIRWDPLTGRTMRITAPRPMPPRSFFQLPELPEEALHRRGCPFCEELEKVAPGFLPGLAGGRRRLEKGDAVLFPNLYPYGRHSAVVRLSTQHHVPITDFEHGGLTDAFALVREYVSLVRAFDSESRYVTVTWNLLPPSGGTLVHPHWQVNLDPIPVNGFRRTREAAANFRERTGCDFWTALVERERMENTRVLAEIGPSVWLSPFAPEALFELWGLLPRKTRFADLADEDASALVTGLVRALAAYASIGRNALNMSLECDEGDSAGPAMRLRVLARSTYRPWYRSDRTHFHVALDESTTIISPEYVTERFRPFFQLGAED